MDNALKYLNVAIFSKSVIFVLPVLYVFYQQNGLSLGEFFYFQGLATFVSLLFYIPAGYLADIFSKKNILIFAMFLSLLRSVLWLSFSGYWVILIGEILYCLSRPFFSGMVDSYTYDYLKTLHQEQSMGERFGRLYFYMSLSSAVSALIGPFLLIDFSIKFLIFLEAVCAGVTILFLFKLPQTPIYNKAKCGSNNMYKEILCLFRLIFRKGNLWVPMCSSALFSATTILLVWCFQPLMLCSFIPVIFFGIIAFGNHMSRAFLGLIASKIGRILSLKNLYHLTGSFFLFSILGIAVSFMFKNTYLTIFSLLIACLTTGLQLAYTILSISYIHDNINSRNRGLVSCLNFMLAAVASSALLCLFKKGIQIASIEACLIGYALFFICIMLLLLRRQAHPK